MTETTTTTNKHRIDEPLDLLLKILQDLLEQTEISQNNISQETLHRISRLYDIFCELMERIKQQNLELEHEFYESAALLVDQILIMRASDAFVKKALATDILQKFAAIILMIYQAVYRSKYVIELLGNDPHVSEKLSNINDVESMDKVMDELWGKVEKVEIASDLADKKLSETVQEIQDLYDAKAAELPEALIEEFRSVSLKSYAIGAAATLALEELETAKEYLHKLKS